MSKHNTPFECVNVLKPRYKFIRNLRRLSDEDLTSDFDALLLINYSSDNPDEQIGHYHFAGHCGKSLISTVLPVFIKI